jgi:hypothetical protein
MLCGAKIEKTGGLNGVGLRINPREPEEVVILGDLGRCFQDKQKDS